MELGAGEGDYLGDGMRAERHDGYAGYWVAAIEVRDERAARRGAEKGEDGRHGGLYLRELSR